VIQVCCPVGSAIPFCISSGPVTCCPAGGLQACCTSGTSCCASGCC
jgi:hypothetical protein